MKVLVVSNMGPKLSAPHQGGFVQRQVNKLKSDGVDLSYYFLSWNGDTILHKIFKYPLFFIKFIFQYVMSRSKYDIIHIHYYFPTIVCALLYKLRNPKVSVVVTCHGSDIYFYESPTWIYKKMSNLVTHWYFTSKSLYQRFYRTVSSKAILCAGYDDSVFKVKYDRKDSDIDCLFVGSLDNNKGIDRLKWLVKELPQFRFAVIGGGPLEATLSQFSDSHRNIELLGSKQPYEVAQYLYKSRTLLSLSRNESFGLVITEANASGTPCIATNTDGATAQLTDWPYIVSQSEEIKLLSELKQNILQLLTLDDKAYRKTQEVAYAKASGFSLSYVSIEIMEKYQSLALCEQLGVPNEK